MSADILLVVGVVLGVFALPSFLNAYTESRPPRAAALMVAVAGAAILFANMMQPRGYEIADVPRAFLRVLGPLIH